MEEVRKNYPTLSEKSRSGRPAPDTKITDFVTTQRRELENEERLQHEAVHKDFIEKNPKIVEWVNEIINEQFLHDLRLELDRRIEKSQAKSLRLTDLTQENIIFTNSKHENFAEVVPGRRFIFIDIESLRGWYEKRDVNMLKVAYVHESVHINSYTRMPKTDVEYVISGFSTPNSSVNWGSFLNEGQTDWLAVSILSKIDTEFAKLEPSSFVSYKPNLDIFDSLIGLIGKKVGMAELEVAYAFDRAYFNGEFFTDEFYDAAEELVGKDLWSKILRLHPKIETREKLEAIYNALEALKLERN
jgi:hypothetical protein